MASRPQFFNATDYFLDRNIREGRGGKVAVYTEAKEYTYDDIQKMTNKTANAFRDLGVRVDDRILVLMLDVPQFYAVFWGAIKIGAVPIPVNTMLTPNDYEYYLNDSHARVLVVSEQLIPVITKIEGDLTYLRDMIVISETKGAHVPFRQMYRRAPKEVKTENTTKDDVCFWLYSSGSTGSPKGAIHSQYDMVAVSDAFGKEVLGLTENDIVFSAARLFFAYGLGNACYLPFSVGGSVVLSCGPAEPRKHPASHDAIPPDGLLRRADALRPDPRIQGQEGPRGRYIARPCRTHEFSSARLCVSAGEALPPDLYHRFKARFGIDILDGIGSTEMLHIFISNSPGDIKPGSTGKPVPGYELRLVDDEGA